MAFTVPKAVRPSITRLARIDDETFNKALEVLERMPVLLGSAEVEKYGNEHAAEIPPDLFKDLMQAGLSLAYGRNTTRLSTDAFVDQVLATSNEWGEPKLNNEQKSKLKRRLEAILSVHVLETGAKAAELLFETTRHMTGARILTDLRPIFAEDVSRPPETTLIMHHLKIEYHQGGGDVETFFTSLDREDLKTLRDAVDRAFAKDEQLRSMLDRARIGVIGLPRDSQEAGKQ